jgi:rod shape-determining protein MreC
MRNLLNFLAKYNSLIIFIILEGFSLYFLTTRNFYHNSRVVNSVISVSNGLETRIENVRNYFHLRDINHSLAFENDILRKNIDILKHKENLTYIPVADTLFHQVYQYTSAEVINNNITRQKNFFTMNKGTLQGVDVDMAVLSDNGIAGVIVGSSPDFSVAMSVLNLDFKVSARIRANGYFGSLSWDGKEDNMAILSEIPQHVTFGIGDTVETTGYSAIFPEGVIIGTVSSFEKTGGDFFRINVRLNTDFRKMHFVTIVGYLRKNEQTGLENRFK